MKLNTDLKTCDRMRNEPCVCGSGKKYKNCCWSKHNTMTVRSELVKKADAKFEKYSIKRYMKARGL